MIIGYIAFVIVGFLGGLFCPYESRITGSAYSSLADGFVHSYAHYTDSSELLLWISIPIAVVAVILCIVYSLGDKEEYFTG